VKDSPGVKISMGKECAGRQHDGEIYGQLSL